MVFLRTLPGGTPFELHSCITPTFRDSGELVFQVGKQLRRENVSLSISSKELVHLNPVSSYLHWLHV